MELGTGLPASTAMEPAVGRREHALLGFEVGQHGRARMEPAAERPEHPPGSHCCSCCLRCRNGARR